MRSEQIQYFLEVAQCGSMSEVAEKNFLTQPAVSTAITKLEKELDVQLLTRSNHGVVLTEAGCTAQQLLLQIQQLSQQLYNSLEPYRTKSSVKEKPLNICTTLEIGKYLVDPAVAHFRQLYPQSAVSVREYDFLDILSAVGQSQCDFGVFCIIQDILAEKEVQQLLEDYQLETEKISSDQLYIGVAPDSPLAQEPSLSLKTILQHPLVIYNSSLNQCWHEMFLRRYITQPQLIKTNRISDLSDLVLHQGYLFFLLNHSLFSVKLAQPPSYVLIPVKEHIKVLTGLLYKKNGLSNPSGQELMQTVKNIL